MAGFWNQASLEPKRQFRWLVYIAGMPQFIATSIAKPSIKVGETTHEFLNYTFYYPGKVTYETISLKIVDPVMPDSTVSLYKILEKAGYTLPSDYSQDDARTISKKAFVDSLGGQIFLEQIGAGSGGQSSAPLEKWTLNNPFITSVNFGSLDYKQDGLVEIDITLRYDWASVDTNLAQDTWKLNDE
jgi:hypothetical protein